MSYFTEVKVVDKITGIAAGVNSAGQLEACAQITAQDSGGLPIFLEATDNGSLKIVQLDGNGNETPTGRTNDPIIVVDSRTANIDAKDHFTVAGYAMEIGDEGTVSFVFTTPDTDKRVHMQLKVQSEGLAFLNIFEGTGDVVGGTGITPTNVNRNSVALSELVVIKDPVSLTEGEALTSYLTRQENAVNLVLKQGTAYQVTVTSGEADNIIGWQFNWHE